MFEDLESIENRLSVIVLVIGLFLAFNIIFKLFGEPKFFLFSLIYFISDILEAPLLFIRSQGIFDSRAFWAMIFYLILYFVFVFIVRKLKEAREEEQELLQEKPKEIKFS